MSNLLRTIACGLALGAAGGVLAADSAPTAAPAPVSAYAGRSPPQQQRPHTGTLMRLDRRYAVPVTAHRRADGSLEIRSGGPLPTAAPQAEVHHER